MPVGRPRKDDKRDNAHQFMLDDEEEAAFNRLVEELDQEAARFGGRASMPGVVRAALASMCEQRGIPWPGPGAKPPEPSSAKRLAKEPDQAATRRRRGGNTESRAVAKKSAKAVD